MWSYSNSTSPIPRSHHDASDRKKFDIKPAHPRALNSALTTQVASRVRFSEALLGCLDYCGRVQQGRGGGKLLHRRGESRRMTGRT